MEAVAARTLTSGLSRLDLDTASELGERAGRVARRLLPGRDALARDNLSRALPDCDPEPLLDEMWRNLGRTFFELTKIRTLERNGAAGVMEFRGGDILRDAAARGRGVVLISGHVANWEMAALGLALQGTNPAIIFRAPNNAAVNELLGKLRPARASYLGKTRQGTAMAFRVLRDRGFVAFLMDHRYTRGVTVNFFGRPVRIAPTAALMARRYHCPIVPIRPERLGDAARFRITAYPPLEVDYDMDPDAFAQVVTQQGMDVLESWIRERPAHWFWVQRLWAGYAAGTEDHR